MTPSRLLWLPACLGLLFLAGCTDPTVSVSGKLIPPPDVKFEKGDSVTIVFTPEEANKGKPWIGAVSEDFTTFTCKDVAPGTYKVSAQMSPYPGGDPKRQEALKEISVRYAADTSKMKIEITSSPKDQSITVDLKSSTVTKS